MCNEFSLAYSAPRKSISWSLDWNNVFLLRVLISYWKQTGLSTVKVIAACLRIKWFSSMHIVHVFVKLLGNTCFDFTFLCTEGKLWCSLCVCSRESVGKLLAEQSRVGAESESLRQRVGSCLSLYSRVIFKPTPPSLFLITALPLPFAQELHLAEFPAGTVCRLGGNWGCFSAERVRHQGRET